MAAPSLFPAAIVAGASVIAYLFGHVSPPLSKLDHDQESPIEIEEKIEPEQSAPIILPQSSKYYPWKLDSATTENDYKLIQMLTEQSLSYQLENSTENAKKKALEIGQFGFPSYSNLRFFDSYCSSINYYRSVPNWSGELITGQDIEKCEDCERKNCSFKEDESVPSMFRSLLSDFKRSGYSRGHLAPAGDHNDIQLNKDLTFFLSSNIVPQELSMNGCDWLRIERFTKQLISSNDNDINKIWIFSGPVFKPIFNCDTNPYLNGNQTYSKPKCNNEIEIINPPKNNFIDGRLKGKIEYQTIGQTMVHVPTHLFKVILAERNTDTDNDDIEKYQLAAFMMQNEAIHDKLPIIDYLVDIDEIEKYTGLLFFPKLLHSKIDSNVQYGNLCLNYNCVYDDDGRTSGWRGFGVIKSAKNLNELECVWNDCCQTEFEHDWTKSMYQREYKYRQKYLLKQIQKRINYMRQFQ